MRVERRRLGVRSQRGVSLLEVLISLFIVGIGVLGLIGMQAKAISNQKDSFDRKAAAELVAQISERMRANHLGFMGNAYTSSFLPGAAIATAAACVTGSPCSPTTLAQSDLAAWHRVIRDRLVDSGAVVAPAPTGATIGTGANSVFVTMIWREARPTTGVDPACSALGLSDATQRCLTAQVFP